MENKKAIIIGATSGIGRGLANTLVENNYKIGITGRREKLRSELKSQINITTVIKSFDIREIEKTKVNLDELIKDLGGLDLLILCSGTGDLNENLDYEIEKTTVETNVVGFTFIVNWAFNYFKSQKSGHLVVISSIAGLRGSRVAPAYSATKSYQINYLESLHQKTTKLNSKIVITDVRPGFVDTAMAKGDGQFWVSSVDKATKQIYKAIKKKKKVVYISKRWRLIGIILKQIPRQFYVRM